MFDYDADRLRGVMLEISRSNISTEAAAWLDDKLGSAQPSKINSAFSLMPRQTGKHIITLKSSEEEIIDQIKPGYILRAWTTDRLCRVCLLMNINPTSSDEYSKTIENLFLSAEMSELIALYSALPIFAYPESWKKRCAEGIRSNIAPVLESIMYHNPYPAKQLDEPSWNQLVLKAFFTDKDVNKIYGFDDRANQELALTLSDYAHERWAAGRSVNPLLWRATQKFIDGRILSDFKKIFKEGSETEKRSAALAIYNSGSARALALLSNRDDVHDEIRKGILTWDKLQIPVNSN